MDADREWLPWSAGRDARAGRVVDVLHLVRREGGRWVAACGRTWTRKTYGADANAKGARRCGECEAKEGAR